MSRRTRASAQEIEDTWTCPLGHANPVEEIECLECMAEPCGRCGVQLGAHPNGEPC